MGYRCSPPPRPHPPLPRDFTRDSTGSIGSIAATTTTTTTTAHPIAILSLGQLARAICIRICETSLRPLLSQQIYSLSSFEAILPLSVDRYRAMPCRLDPSSVIDDVSGVAGPLALKRFVLLDLFRYILRRCD